MFSYFTGEGTSDGEQLYAALSKGNDPLKWRELNDGKPVLTSTLGEKGLRDPFIIRSPEGDKFYQIATDLRMYGNGNWDQVQRTGSKSIMVWESTDLINWTDQRLVKVSPDTAGNTWAPEAFYDEEAGEYVVYWASALYPTTETAGRDINTSYQQMMYATTRDFVTFSPAGENFFEFPYDWRRDNRVAARRLQRESREWLVPSLLRPGGVPVRPEENRLRPVPATDAHARWTGWVADLPARFDPRLPEPLEARGPGRYRCPRTGSEYAETESGLVEL